MFTIRQLLKQMVRPRQPQAKGRVERLFNTLQECLVQELRLAGITAPAEASTFINGPFKADFNARFAKPARESQSAWRPLPKGVDVHRVCSFRMKPLSITTIRPASQARSWNPPGPRHRGYAKALIDQPLHVGFLDDAGGTKTVVTFRGKQQKLHQLWDTGILESEQDSAKTLATRLDEELPVKKHLRWLTARQQNGRTSRWRLRENTCTRYPNLEK